MLKIQLCVL